MIFCKFWKWGGGGGDAWETQVGVMTILAIVLALPLETCIIYIYVSFLFPSLRKTACIT